MTSTNRPDLEGCGGSSVLICSHSHAGARLELSYGRTGVSEFYYLARFYVRGTEIIEASIYENAEDLLYSVIKTALCKSKKRDDCRYHLEPEMYDHLFKEIMCFVVKHAPSLSDIFVASAQKAYDFGKANGRYEIQASIKDLLDIE